MKVALIHFSDIHIKTSTDFILSKASIISSACTSIINDCVKVIFIITGDIAFSGKKEEYDYALSFLKEIENNLKESMGYINSIEYILVPGNHDCNYENDKIRQIVMDSVHNNDTIDDSDIITHCLKPQLEFWKFNAGLTGENETPIISYQKDIQLTIDKSICFNCYNSSFFSTLEEKPGQLVIPENYFLPCQKHNSKGGLNISLFHHNPGWLNPSTTKNNKKQFEQMLLETSHIVLCGHEHQSSQCDVSDLARREELTYLEGGALQFLDDSAFSIYVYDANNDTLSINNLTLAQNKDFYEIKTEPTVNIIPKSNILLVKPAFVDYLNSIDIPIKHPQKQDISLNDIFVWQDLESFSDTQSHIVQYVDAKDVFLGKTSDKVLFIEGEPQSGKTSLLKRVFQLYLDQGQYPLLINGQDIIHPNVTAVLKKSYKKVYNTTTCPFDKFYQMDKSKKVLLIDDLEKSCLNTAGIKELYTTLLKSFDHVIVTSKVLNDVGDRLLINQITDYIVQYKLSSLGYLKRNSLIEKWIRLGKDQYTIDEFATENEIKLTFDQITNLLGEHLIPSYPIFILSLLQSLNPAMKQFDISKTTYAFCYKSLIISALSRSGVELDRIPGLINILKELSYKIYEEKRDSFNPSYFHDFYQWYARKYRTLYSEEKVVEIMCTANIFKQVDDLITFSYRYIYYYLIAEKISGLENSTMINDITEKLCENIHSEENANILLFLIHHTENQTFLEQLLFTSMLPFEDSPMATLTNDDTLIKDLLSLVDEIKTEILLEDVNASKRRSEELKQSDEFKRELENHNVEEEDNNPITNEFYDTIKIIRILGQIVKNHGDTFEKSKLVQLITEAYKLGFRAIGFYNDMIDKSKDEIVEHIIKENHHHHTFDDKVLEQKVYKLLQVLLYHMCLSTFSSLAYSVGNARMDDLYDEVAKQIGSPAAKIVSFTIKSYYAKMKISDLKEIIEEFKTNPVATQIVKSRVAGYVYHHNIDYSTRQQISSICHLRLMSSHPDRPE